MRQVKAGSADISSTVRIVDDTSGQPETGVVAATAGLAFNYRREGGLLVSIAGLSDLALLTSAHTDGGLLHIGHGYYRVDVPDAAFAAGVDGVLIEGTATGMVVIGTYVQLVGYDPRTELTAAVLTVAGGAAQPGDEMDLVDAPNPTAVGAIQSGLALTGEAATAALALQGGDGDTLESLSDQLDMAQADLDDPDQYKADVSALALEANVQGYAAAALVAYDPPTDAEMDAALAALHVALQGDIAGLGFCGAAGMNQCSYTVTDSTTGLPIANVRVWVTTDAAGLNVVDNGYTDMFGIVIFWLDSGSYYFWRSRSGYSFINPDLEAVP